MPAPADLEITRENLASRLDDLLELAGQAKRVEVLAAAIDGIARHYRQLGIACLLCEADTGALFRYLCAGGLARAHVLERVRWAEVIDLQYLCATSSWPFFDAVAAGDIETAARIARTSRSTWAEEDEDEAGFLRMRFLMGLIEPKLPGVPPQGELLENLLRLAGPDEDPWSAACDALHRRNASHFDEAMAVLTQSLADDWAEERKNPNRDPDQMLTEAFVSVEALALVRLARLAGMPAPEELPLAPSLTLVDPPAPVRPPEAWMRGA
jgi:immunity protein 49 of polymorphic toxin system